MSGGDLGARPSANPLMHAVGLAREGVRLIQQEWSLARQESVEKLAPAARSAGLVVGGGCLAAIGGVYLLQTVVRLLATRMPPWLASLLSGAVFTAGGIALAARGGQQLRRLDLVPWKTINSLREDKEWLLRQIRSRLI